MSGVRGLRRRGLALVVVSGLVAGLLVAPGSGVVAAADPVVCVDEASTEAAALSVAAACGRLVAVGPSRSEFVQVLAKPDGRLMLESAVVPQRTRRADGRWADVDLNLVRGGDGLLRPGASVADVAFSGGGDGPLVTLRRAGRTLTVSWPGWLPAPAVSGEAATYAEVLPGVDLVVRATYTGFSHVLVVKTPAAAASPAVRQVRFRLGGDVTVRGLTDGSLRAMVGDAVMASAEKAVMWDSATAAGSGGGSAARAGVSAVSPSEGMSSAAGPGDAARVGSVATRLAADGDLVLTPDQALLSSASAFPVYIDPQWSVVKQKWAYATDDGSNNTDYSVARVGLNPDTGVLYRSFFEFSTTSGSVSLKGKHIESAYVQMTLDHSWSCGYTWTHMYLTPVINATMKASWSKMRLKAWLSSAESHANEGDGCSDSPQADMVVNFDGSTVTSQVQAAATAKWNTITVGFCACNSSGQYERERDRWKKWFPNKAKLIVNYDSVPGKPSSLQVAGVACPSSGVLTVGTLTPTLSAVLPDADGGQTLTGRFEWVVVPAGGVGAITDTSPARLPAPSRPQAVANKRATTAALSGVVKGTTYAFRVRATDPAPYSITGPWSGWCQFAVDTTKPPVSVVPVSLPSGPGMPGTFRIESTASDVTTFKYGWGAATTAVAATGTSPKSATITVTAPKYGLNILNVSAVDATLNEGVGSTEFTVGRPSPPVARWGLETYPGVDTAAAMADQQPGLAGDTPLTGTALTWTNDARLVGGQTVTFNTSSQAVATGLTPDTTKSFSVAAWVRMRFDGGSQTFISKDGGPGQWSTFRVGMRTNSAGVQHWCFGMATSLTAEEGQFLCSSTTAVTGRWTHIAASYDSIEDKMHLWVDGTHYTRSFTTPLTASGPIVLGRGMNAGSPADRHFGNIADVQFFDRVLVDQDFTGQLASDPESGGFDEPGILSPIEVGAWDFEAAVPCHVADLRDTCEAPDADASGRWLALTRGSSIGAGHSASDLGLWLDDEYFPEEGHTEPSEEYGRSAYKVGTTPPDAEGNEFTLWQDTPVLKTDQSYTLSAWVMLDSLSGVHTALSQLGVHKSAGWLRYSPTGGKWQFIVDRDDLIDSTSIGVSSTSLAEEGVWTHVVGVYDAGASQVRIYVNGNREGVQAVSFTPFASSGPLLVGKTLWQDQLVDQWTGGIDDVRVFQGAMTDAQVRALYDGEAG